MTTLNMSDFTPAGAFCAAINAASDSDRNSRVIEEVIVKPGKTASLLVTIRDRVEAVIQSVRKQHAETA